MHPLILLFPVYPIVALTRGLSSGFFLRELTKRMCLPSFFFCAALNTCASETRLIKFDE